MYFARGIYSFCHACVICGKMIIKIFSLPVFLAQRDGQRIRVVRVRLVARQAVRMFSYDTHEWFCCGVI
jgi:hypothetical protein